MIGCSYPPTYDGNDQGMRGNFTILSYSRSYDGEKYLDWEMTIEQVFNSHLVPEIHRVQQATSEFTDFAYICWYGLVVTNVLPSTWEQLKKAMRDCFIPLSYKHDLLRKIQCLLQGNMSFQEYYKEYENCRVYYEINEYVNITKNRLQRDR